MKNSKNYLKKKFPSKIPLLVSCGIPGHPIRTTNGDNLQKRVWCKYCTKVYTYEHIKNMVKEVGFERTGREGILIISKDEFNNTITHTKEYPTTIKIRVHCGVPTHKERITTGTALLNKRWCRYCTQLYTYEKVKKLVENVGISKNGLKGILLYPENKNEFEKYKNKIKSKYNKYPSHMPIKLFCSIREHKPWITTPTNLQQGSWCPICSEGEYERICRWYFEQIFKCSFPQTNLSDVVKIRNIVNNIEIIENYKGTMHFDGYNIIEIKNIVFKLAFEYNGPQHYIFPNQFHNNTTEGYEQFKDQKKRDINKQLLCKDKINNIILIEFPYHIDKNMNHPHIIQDFIVKQFENKTKIKLPIIPQFDHRNGNIRQNKNNQLKLDKFSSELE